MPPNKFANYTEASKLCISWLQTHAKNYLKEKEKANHWEQFQIESNIFKLAQVDIGNNSNFNMEASTKIINSIDNLKQLIIDKYHPTEDQVTYMSARLDYLSEATNRLGKFDWSNSFVSFIIAIAINMGVEYKHRQRIF